MKTNVKLKRWIYISVVLTGLCCREPYTINIPTNGDGVLVVEGIVNGNGKTSISLSRTTRLADKRIAPEKGALLILESENTGAVYPMLETTEGNYESGDLTLDPSVKYRLRIQTSDNREYSTDFKNVMTTPPIDSLTWKQTSSGLNIFSNAHDQANTVQYYKWDYEETWEFHSAYRTFLGFKEVPPDQNGGYKYVLTFLDPVTQSVDTTLYYCYNERKSSGVNIASTESLDSSVLLTPILSYPRGAIELGVMYSILVKQYAMSKDGFDFFTRMKKNTEQLGSIFDAQPSELSGNIRCITNPSELVIGYIEFTTMESKRIFINNENLEDWGYIFEGCETVPENPYLNDVSLFEDIVKRDLHPTTIAESSPGGGIKSFNVQKEECVDCRLRGSNIKPSFWP
jgi:hypothetical protein